MLRHSFLFALALAMLMACQAPTLPTLEIPQTPTLVNAAVSNPTLAPTTIPAPSQVAATSPSVGVSPTPLQTATQAPSVTVSVNTPTRSLTATSRATTTATTATSTIITATESLTATATFTQTATLHPTARLRPTQTPAVAATLTQLIAGQRVTAMYVGNDGSIYYGVAPSDESLQFPANTVFQLWKWTPGGAPLALTPATMHMIGGVLVHNGTIYFNELGTLRRMPDNNQVSEGEVVMRFPAYENNKNLPYGHMNSALATYTLNGRQVMLMSMGSILDSSFPCSGCPANISEPYYEDFPTGRINYATFDWLEQQHEYIATHGIAGEYDEFARGVRNPWSMTVGSVNGQTHVLAVDNDPSFTPEKYDDNPANSGDELNDIILAGNYGHPYFYGGGQPIVNFPDTSVPSGVAVAAGKIFVGLQVGNEIVKVDLAKRTYTPVLENVLPFNLYAVGDLLYIANFDGIHVIDARGL